jgi:hypothetical protein
VMGMTATSCCCRKVCERAQAAALARPIRIA